MRHFFGLVSAILVPFFFAPSAPAVGQEFQVLPKGRSLDLPIRKPDDVKFGLLPSVKVHVFQDQETQHLLYISDQGKSLAVVPSGKAPGGVGKGPKWHHRLVLPVRHWDDKEFNKDTPKINLEVYRDEPTGNLVYVSHTGSLAVLPADHTKPGKPGQPPLWLYQLPLKVREANKFNFDTLKCNIEVYWDESSGALLYAGQNGAISVVAAAKPKADHKAILPDWSHALDLRARKPDQQEFNKDVPLFGVEIYQDRNAGTWIHITEKLHFAVLRGIRGDGKPLDKALAPRWITGHHPAGARNWSAELYLNPNTNNLIFITSHGAVATIGSKK